MHKDKQELWVQVERARHTHWALEHMGDVLRVYNYDWASEYLVANDVDQDENHIRGIPKDWVRVVEAEPMALLEEVELKLLSQGSFGDIGPKMA